MRSSFIDGDHHSRALSARFLGGGAEQRRRRQRRRCARPRLDGPLRRRLWEAQEGAQPHHGRLGRARPRALRSRRSSAAARCCVAWAGAVANGSTEALKEALLCGRKDEVPWRGSEG